ncbi:hypothetical protein E2562_017389 [Oryza meyeriana var. granulata]|uniref:Glutaredoxin domain-containing protein n=1 Tax=Oryza meyeriana var. granulata TaxID=110450 RepID=A0A6G1D4W9_9ORYZ|nr:hypothetical protein E2562_017389 [Oryza meyeriana var. granulata]
MIIKTLKARILRALKSSLPAAAVASPPPSPTKPGRAVVVVAADAFSDDASFFDAHETPTKNAAEPIDDWELVDEEGRVGGAPPAAADPLREFPARCPPGGEGAVVLYTTTLRGIRKTFEDCNGVRALLENLDVAFQERDVSMDRGLRDELWSVTGEKAVPPRLFVRGRDVGGAAQVLALHEDGRLVALLASPDSKKRSRGAADGGGTGKCNACGGLRFVVCGECDGSRKVFDGERGRGVRCRGCNENGLVMCTLCL